MNAEMMTAISERQVGDSLWFLYNRMSHSLTRKLEAGGVSVVEWMVLRELSAVGEASPSGLARRLGMPRGSVSRIATRLKAKSLLWFKSSMHEAHSHTLILTTTGRRLLPKLDVLSGQNDLEFFGHLPPQDQQTFDRILKEIVTRCGSHQATVNR